MNLIQNC